MKTIILTCDICGMKGHEAEQPSKECVEALKEELNKLMPIKIDQIKEALKKKIPEPVDPYHPPWEKDKRWL